MSKESQETRAAVAACVDETGKDDIENNDNVDEETGEETTKQAVLAASTDDTL